MNQMRRDDVTLKVGLEISPNSNEVFCLINIKNAKCVQHIEHDLYQGMFPISHFSSIAVYKTAARSPDSFGWREFKCYAV